MPSILLPEVAVEPKWFRNGSMNITLKNVPETVYRVIEQSAKEQGRSLNAQIILVFLDGGR
jgi:hypothetical protein